MIEIILSQFFIVALWALVRYNMANSKYCVFNMNEIHHWDFLLFSICSPMWYCLNYPIIALVVAIIPCVIALDDVYQHYANIEMGPLKRLTFKLWSWFF